jgi:multicomponent Na+:H+ antiporter subunit G
MFDILGFIFITIGAIFLLISSIGLLRMPDTITRMHAGTKASTLGSLLVILGVMFLEPSLWFKLFFLALFILITNPLSSSILARSTYLKYGFLNKSGMDDLKEKRK